MFELEKNNLFSTGTVKYTDDYENKVIYKFKGNKSIVKIKFANERASCDTINISVKEPMEGVQFNCYFNPSLNQHEVCPSIDECIDGVKKLIPYLYDLTLFLNKFYTHIKSLEIKKQIIGEENVEKQSRQIYDEMKKFEEFANIKEALS